MFLELQKDIFIDWSML